MDGELENTRVLVTRAHRFMGPAILEKITREGAEAIADTRDLTDPDRPARLIAETSPLDALIVNIEHAPYRVATQRIRDDQWLAGFDVLVHPLMRLVRAVVPQMIDSGGGAIVVIGSSAPLRPMSPQLVAYVAARSAQLSFVQSAGRELAKYNIRLNAIAQNFIASDTYYPEAVVQHPLFNQELAVNVPAGRLGLPSETAELACFLSSRRASFHFGQVLRLDGGWS